MKETKKVGTYISQSSKAQKHLEKLFIEENIEFRTDIVLIGGARKNLYMNLQALPTLEVDFAGRLRLSAPVADAKPAATVTSRWRMR